MQTASDSVCCLIIAAITETETEAGECELRGRKGSRKPRGGPPISARCQPGFYIYCYSLGGRSMLVNQREALKSIRHTRHEAAVFCKWDGWVVRSWSYWTRGLIHSNEGVRSQRCPRIFGRIKHPHTHTQLLATSKTSKTLLTVTLCWSCRSVQLSGPDSVCVGGEPSSSVRSDRQLQWGELRLSGVQRALRPMLLALLPHLPPSRTQRGADPTGRSPVSLPGNQRDGPGWGGRRPHVLRRRKPWMDKMTEWMNALSSHFKRPHHLCHLLSGKQTSCLEVRRLKLTSDFII